MLSIELLWPRRGTEETCPLSFLEDAGVLEAAHVPVLLVGFHDRNEKSQARDGKLRKAEGSSEITSFEFGARDRQKAFLVQVVWELLLAASLTAEASVVSRATQAEEPLKGLFS